MQLKNVIGKLNRTFALRLHLGLDGTGVESLRYEDLIINADSIYSFGFPIGTEDKCDTALSGYIEHANPPDEKKHECKWAVFFFFNQLQVDDLEIRKFGARQYLGLMIFTNKRIIPSIQNIETTQTLEIARYRKQNMI